MVVILVVLELALNDSHLPSNNTELKTFGGVLCHQPGGLSTKVAMAFIMS